MIKRFVHGIKRNNKNNNKNLTLHLKQETWKSFPSALILEDLVCPFFGRIDLRQPPHLGLNFLKRDNCSHHPTDS